MGLRNGHTRREMKLTNLAIDLKIYTEKNFNPVSSILLLSSSICARLMHLQFQKYLYYFATTFLDKIHSNIWNIFCSYKQVYYQIISPIFNLQIKVKYYGLRPQLS